MAYIGYTDYSFPFGLVVLFACILAGKKKCGIDAAPHPCGCRVPMGGFGFRLLVHDAVSGDDLVGDTGKYELIRVNGFIPVREPDGRNARREVRVYERCEPVFVKDLLCFNE